MAFVTKYCIVSNILAKEDFLKIFILWLNFDHAYGEIWELVSVTSDLTIDMIWLLFYAYHIEMIFFSKKLSSHPRYQKVQLLSSHCVIW